MMVMVGVIINWKWPWLYNKIEISSKCHKTWTYVPTITHIVAFVPGTTTELLVRLTDPGVEHVHGHARSVTCIVRTISRCSWSTTVWKLYAIFHLPKYTILTSSLYKFCFCMLHIYCVAYVTLHHKTTKKSPDIDFLLRADSKRWDSKLLNDI